MNTKTSVILRSQTIKGKPGKKRETMSAKQIKGVISEGRVLIINK